MTLPALSGAARAWGGSFRDLLAGLLFVAVGAGVAYKARSYTIGVPSNSGPGFFPFYLGLILMGIGAVVGATALVRRSPGEDGLVLRLRPFLWVLLPVILFGVLLTQGGLVLSTFVVVLLSSLASRSAHGTGALLNAAILAVIVLGAFGFALRIQIPLWPAPVLEWLR